jgi:hypothetical protein
VNIKIKVHAHADALIFPDKLSVTNIFLQNNQSSILYSSFGRFTAVLLLKKTKYLARRMGFAS